jgi:VCBS repeat-containing protein
VGSFNFSIAATDTGGLAATTAFAINVANLNDAPVAHNDAGNAAEDGGPVTLTAASLLVNDTDIDTGDSKVIVSVAAQSVAGAAVTLVDGNVAYDPGSLFQSLAQGMTATDTFTYTMTDAAGAASTATVTMTIAGGNDAPVVTSDSASVREDVTSSASGNVLANDSDLDAGTVLSVANFGSYAGAYGTLILAGDGSYAYTLANGSAAVQALAAGQVVTDSFSYTATDGIATASALLTVSITGSNDAPILAVQTGSQNAVAGTAFRFALPTDTFTDVDAGDTLAYRATLGGGGALPGWLVFDAATRTFSGTPGSNDAGVLSLRVTATDAAGATATDSFVLNIQGATSQGQTLIGTDGNDNLVGGAGNDLLVGGLGSDRLAGEAGDDVLGYTADAVWSGQYRAVNRGSPGYAGSGEQVQLAGKNRSYDIFDGGAGNDALVGTAGNDALLLDDIYSPPDGYAGPRIRQVELISMGDGNDIVDLTSPRFTYGDVTIDGGAGNDVLWASAGNDYLLGGAGNDTLGGGAGNDILDGGSGNNQVAGGLGDDLYLHGAGGGHDVIEEQGGQDVIRFSIGISANAVSVSRSRDDLVLKLAGQDGSVTVRNWFGAAANRVERVEFADGTVWDESALNSRLGHGFSDVGSSGPGAHGNNQSTSFDATEKDKRPDGKPDPIRDASDAIAARLARAPQYDFSALSAYLAHPGGSSGPLNAAQIAQQWNVLRNAIQHLGQDDEHAKQGVPGARSGDDLVHGAMYWGYAGSVGQSASSGGMTALSGLNEGFKKLG